MIYDAERTRPLQILYLTFPPEQGVEVLKRLRRQGANDGFAVRLSRDPGRPGDDFLQMFRSDLRVVGHLSARAGALDLVVTRVSSRVVPAAPAAVVSGLRGALAEVPGLLAREAVLAFDDEPTEFGKTIHAARRAVVRIDPASREELGRALVAYAAANGFAARLHMTGPEAWKVAADLYRDDAWVLASAPFAPGEIHVGFYAAELEPAPPAVIDAAFEAFRRAMEALPGARFEEKH